MLRDEVERLRQENEILRSDLDNRVRELRALTVRRDEARTYAEHLRDEIRGMRYAHTPAHSVPHDRLPWE
jgi:hypothetical protein